MLRFLALLIGAFALIAASHPDGEGRGVQGNASQSAAASLANISSRYDQETKRAEHSDDEEERCGNGNYGSNADLCAQWKAADAAAESAFWAKAAGAAGVFSTIAVLIALCLTWQANNIARRAAFDQLRPYIAYCSKHTTMKFSLKGQFVKTNLIENEKSFDEIDVRIGIKNFGQTPARNVNSSHFFAVYPEGAISYPIIYHQVVSLADIPPSDGSVIPVPISLTKESLDLLVNQGGSLHGFVKVEYTGIGNGRCTGRCTLKFHIQSNWKNVCSGEWRVATDDFHIST